MSYPKPEWPQDILDRAKGAYHEPTRRERTADYPIPYKFVVFNENPDMSEAEVEGIFDTLEEANQATLAVFSASYSDFLDQKRDMSNVYEKGTKEEQENEIVWEFGSNGELSLVATDGSNGEQYLVWVEAHGN
ncbi:hypothetical protein N7508_002552 [Penicillium antarcticum]|uniref:uncharacterized protein n=1 Tax=Penicillium antarcticum TaxID=416450 RepID=UPI0023A5021C|nr:uncharacterized protein N7508_002552 [Penicillium antarcticum]KAJ5318044.1 hypothetical protein N7508_002552 [Penicillium antarcticum]